MHVSNLRPAWRFAGILLLALVLSLGRGSTVQAFPIAQGGPADALLSEGEKHQVIQFNPGAALQKRIFTDAFVPNSSEFSLQVSGVSYTAQRAENLSSGQVRVYYTITGDWGNVHFVERGSESGPLDTALLQEGEKHQVIQFNPGAALQKGIFTDGFVPNSSEFSTQANSTSYTAQRAENLGNGQVRVYYVVTGDWANVQTAIRGGTNAAAPAAPPAATAPPAAPVRNTGSKGFGYGIQADLITDGNHQRIFDSINALGFNWVKQQVEWKRYEPNKGQYDWAPLDRIIDDAGKANVNVLFSVVKAPPWARPAGDTDEGPPSNPADYGDFVGKLAERYRGRLGAIEVWNEQNLYYEWGGRGHKLSAARYVQILAAAYNAIKAADPNIVVVSGAPTPTGVNDGDIAIDDLTYLRQMYAAGLARYSDAIGAHPSGYNNPPDADWRSYSRPGVSFGASGHPSWFFRGTMEGFRNIMVANGDGGKRIWPTEFGWASVDGLGAGPARGYEYASDNSQQDQASFIVRAYQIGKSWGWVGPMFLWNLNFAPVAGAGDEKAAFGIVRADWGRRPAFDALAQMAK